MKYPISVYVKGVQARFKALANPALYQKLPLRRLPSNAPYKLAIGPVSFAGQAYEWAEALNRRCEDVSAVSMAFTTGGFAFPIHEEIRLNDYRLKRWQKSQLEHLSHQYTHVLSEAGRAMCGNLMGSRATPIREAERLSSLGVKVGHIAHGSDIRCPSYHLANYPHSPFSDPDHEIAINTLENRSRHLIHIFQRSPENSFVTTPDLLDYVPGATWLPVVVDVKKWQSKRVADLRNQPRVLFAPSKSWIKGGSTIDQTLQVLEDQGLIVYTRVQGISSEKMPALIENSDIVIDQLAIGAYGLMAVQAMAAGRLVVGHVADQVRERVETSIPIVEASAETLANVLEDIVNHPSQYENLIPLGHEFVTKYHDGAYSTKVLESWIKKS
jgi:hypothetical protein